jgi:UDPglucose 6-dehydrogenase
VCPEFISEGSAYEDMLRPHRVLIGGDDSKAVEALRGLILKWVPARKILRMDMASAQLAKLLANALLAQRVASVNSLTAVCEAMGGDLRTVAKAVGLDPRIGRHYLNPSAGFGGSCLEKDVRLLCAFAKMMGIEDVSRYWSEIAEANDRQIERQISRLSRLAGPKGRVALIGLSFKPGTPDIRNSVSLRIAQGLLRNGHQVAGFDPLVKKVSITGLLVATSLSSAVRDAKVVAVLHAVGGLDRLPWINALGRQPRTFVDYTGRKKPSWLPATIDLITVGKATRCTP